MKLRTKGNRRRTRQEVDALLGRYRSSGMTVRAFCEAEGVTESVLYRRLQAQRRKPPEPTLVEVKPSIGMARCYTVETPDGYRVEVPADFGGDDLRRLLGALRP